MSNEEKENYEINKETMKIEKKEITKIKIGATI